MSPRRRRGRGGHGGAGFLQAWAPEFGGRKWVLGVRDWPSQNGVLLLVEKIQVSAHPILIERTSSIFYGKENQFSGAQVAAVASSKRAGHETRLVQRPAPKMSNCQTPYQGPLSSLRLQAQPRGSFMLLSAWLAARGCMARCVVSRRRGAFCREAARQSTFKTLFGQGRATRTASRTQAPPAARPRTVGMTARVAAARNGRRAAARGNARGVLRRPAARGHACAHLAAGCGGRHVVAAQSFLLRMPPWWQGCRWGCQLQRQLLSAHWLGGASVSNDRLRRRRRRQDCGQHAARY